MYVRRLQPLHITAITYRCTDLVQMGNKQNSRPQIIIMKYMWEVGCCDLWLRKYFMCKENSNVGFRRIGLSVQGVLVMNCRHEYQMEFQITTTFY